ncbi:MAG: hemolysin XhlA family protein [Microcystis aeruginosa PMC 728.11]|uniref:hemolysin XhlA family protein n=1 Tax=Microcystis sp. LE19-84.1B TaxID=3016438 RepID=UPI001E16A950|nr:hemolysin XhlA family protein [Microcystis sp. LE19-84.1B]MBE5227705.1 hemolysin XhlA family protein [Microcystis aeruginosa PMC 728.11]MCZ8224911.1 hemolysin XhlA family protein [Microcystis sp. LE19-84.1B]
MSVTIEQDLKEILGSINQKLDNLQKDVMDIKIVQARLEEKVDSLEKDIEGVKEDIKELKGSQKAQIWTLIGILGTALIGTVIRYIILPFPQS